MFKKFTVLLVSTVLLFACQKNEQTPVAEQTTVAKIKERFQTPRNEADNIDSPSFWAGQNQKPWLLATAKVTDVIVVNDATNGEEIKRIGGSGQESGQFSRPNGIFVTDDLVLVVERDNRRVQVMRLPEFKTLGFLQGESQLMKPYGIFVMKTGANAYRAYITDNYETADEQIPPDAELGERVYIYEFTVQNDSLQWELKKKFGATSGDGVLRVVESVYGDPVHDRLFVAEEDETQTSVKIYNMAGEFTGPVLGRGLFQSQVEGITLYKTGEKTGYWIVTDQGKGENTFHLFDRLTLQHLGAFSGENTLNTDGVWLTQMAFGNFPEGAFFAVHDDGNVSAFDWKIITNVLNLK
ncbi:MAG: hypothetical protein DWQ10_02220 [Calditrichaeota bacterium]|nr:MAG: hypothetical protein DWQ10_02220 [Calditrichota bacterium]